jgi:hypothetical protein
VAIRLTLALALRRQRATFDGRYAKLAAYKAAENCSHHDGRVIGQLSSK